MPDDAVGQLEWRTILIRSTPVVRRLALIFVVFALAASSCLAASVPKNIILLIGDGMGVGAITAARCAGPGPNGRLLMDGMPVTGFALTHPVDALVTDSAASGTALATGVKTKNGMIGQDPKGAPLLSILEAARDMGKSTGVVTTDAIVGATPAAFYAHVENRKQGDDIAAQVLPARMNIAFGGGRSRFIPKTDSQDGRKDGRDLLDEARKRGYDVVTTPEELRKAAGDRILGLFDDSSNPALDELTAKTLSVLNRNPKGFFVMVESSWPDGGGHANNAELVVKGVRALDAALGKALELAKSDGQTLVVVTADHDTGGLAIQDSDDKNPGFKPQWTGGGHTGNMVAVYAFGPGSERFAGTLDNTEIPKIFAELWGVKLNQ